jgi:uncharacterized protein (TIGR02145 family)
MTSAFDATYTTNNADNNYAKLPTTDQTIYQTDKALGETPAPLTDFTAYYAAKLTLDTIAGDYKTTITYSAIGDMVPCQWDESISFDSPLCQEPSVACQSGPAFKGNIGDIRNVGTITAGWDIGDTGIATDNRGNGQNYCIGKLADNNIWMLNNLKLGSTDPITLTSGDTNLPSDTSFNLPALAHTYNTYAYDLPYVYADDFGYGAANKSATTDINSPDFYGYYYNWCAAKGGIQESCTASDANPTSSITDICPANWRMPIDGGSSEFAILSDGMSDGAYRDLANSSDNPDHFVNFQFSGPFRGVFAGDRDESNWYNQGSNGFVWSASHRPGVPSEATFLYIRQSSIGWNQPAPRFYHFSVRCLLQ